MTKLPRQACCELLTLKFVGEGINALIIGKPSTGKSPIAKAVAYSLSLATTSLATQGVFYLRISSA